MDPAENEVIRTEVTHSGQTLVVLTHVAATPLLIVGAGTNILAREFLVLVGPLQVCPVKNLFCYTLTFTKPTARLSGFG